MTIKDLLQHNILTDISSSHITSFIIRYPGIVYSLSKYHREYNWVHRKEYEVDIYYNTHYIHSREVLL